ncbi:hypothetical protein [Streptomyces spiralis]
MLRVVYKATDLAPGTISDWYEDRGYVEIRIARGTEAAEFVPSLNETLRDFLSQAEWFQLWDGEIISVNHPRSPLRVSFELSKLTPAPIVHIREYKGEVVLFVRSSATAEQFVNSINPPLEEFLAGGQWFQLWRGEIVTMDSAGSAAA